MKVTSISRQCIDVGDINTQCFAKQVSRYLASVVVWGVLAWLFLSLHWTGFESRAASPPHLPSKGQMRERQGEREGNISCEERCWGRGGVADGHLWPPPSIVLYPKQTVPWTWSWLNDGPFRVLWKDDQMWTWKMNDCVWGRSTLIGQYKRTFCGFSLHGDSVSQFGGICL